MDTSHLAEHAGAASSFFASIFVVATLSMRTMIPLRVRRQGDPCATAN